MSLYKETTLRSIVKTIGFKVLTTSVTAIFFMGIGKALLLHAIMTIIYLIYERVWNKIRWGKETVTLQDKN